MLGDEGGDTKGGEGEEWKREKGGKKIDLS